MNGIILALLLPLAQGASAAPPELLPGSVAFNLQLAGLAVREVNSLGLRSPSAMKMRMDAIKPGSPEEDLLPQLRAEYDAALKDLLDLRAEFGREFGAGLHPTIEYLGGRMRELTKKYNNVANCTEQALLAQAWLRGRGVRGHLVVLETFDWWTMQLLPDKNHVFTVFGLQDKANPAVPAQWGMDSVIADPWGGLNGAAGETLEYLLDDVFKLDRTHQLPRYHVLDYETLYRLPENNLP